MPYGPYFGAQILRSCSSACSLIQTTKTCIHPRKQSALISSNHFLSLCDNFLQMIIHYSYLLVIAPSQFVACTETFSIPDKKIPYCCMRNTCLSSHNTQRVPWMSSEQRSYLFSLFIANLLASVLSPTDMNSHLVW